MVCSTTLFNNKNVDGAVGSFRPLASPFQNFKDKYESNRTKLQINVSMVIFSIKGNKHTAKIVIYFKQVFRRMPVIFWYSRLQNSNNFPYF